MSASCAIHHRFENGFKERSTVLAAQLGLARSLGMRHKTEDVACPIRHPGDSKQRPVWVGSISHFARFIAVAKRNLIVFLELAKGRIRRKVTAFAVSDG